MLQAVLPTNINITLKNLDVTTSKPIIELQHVH